MLLHRIFLNPRNKEARRDLADPYQMHASLSRVFSPPERKCPGGEFLWRLEPETDPTGLPILLVQSRAIAQWDRLGYKDWFARSPDEPKIWTALTAVTGQRFRFRLRANPCITRQRKRLGLFKREDQVNWLKKKGEMHGFTLDTAHISQEKMIHGNRNDGTSYLRIFSVLFDGILTTVDAEKLDQALSSGIGHGKVMGLGLLSLAPISYV